MRKANHIRVISGGQTGADRAALDAARRLGIETGGWAPKGWRTEDGADPSLASFGLKTTATSNYTMRTRLNVCDADATVIIRRDGLSSPGSNLTVRIAREEDKPCLTVELPDSCGLDVLSSAMEQIVRFLESVLPSYDDNGKNAVVVNFAGNRESSAPGIYEQAHGIISAALLRMVELDDTCFACEHGVDALAAREADLVKTVGWYIHYVPTGDGQTPTGCNIHTHHVLESFGHLDVQLVLALPQRIAMDVLHTMIDRVRAGEKFSAGQDYDGIIGGYRVRFIDAIECGRPVLRMIFPDADGNLDPDKMQHSHGFDFCTQYL